MYRLTQIVALALSIYHRLVDSPRGNRVVACGVYTRKTLVVPQVQVGLKAVLCHVALTVLVRVQRTWVDVNVGVEFLNSHFVAACLQQLANAGGYDSLSQRRNHTARNENVLCFHKTNCILWTAKVIIFFHPTLSLPSFSSTFSQKVSICKQKPRFAYRFKL